ncbi:hypothetical protein PG999_004147 [Apiospora kogelbergensis]|uniref:Xylanolytic transcriptional activator regulatory domain-containing protein n=1 Tax=Apiospora kogelbergensis TaxID=1337665 RepID=A0AAW0R5P3_9PEZI
MGRWGHRLFEGDHDLDIAIEISDSVDEDLPLSQLVHQTDMLAPNECKTYYQTEEYAVELAEHVIELRQKLDASTGDRLFDFYRAKENESSGLGQGNGKYRVILVGALIMRTGAKIRDSDLQHLRELVPQVHSSPGFALPLGDGGFRDPGKAQFLAALNHYTPGTPRNYSEPSCFTCGQVEADINKAPLRCTRCHSAYYCDTVLGRSWQVAGDSGRRREARIRKTAPLSHCRPPSFANRIPHPQIPQVPESSQCNVQQWSRRQQATYGSLGREATKEERFLMPQLPQPQSDAPTLSYTERLEQRIKELESEVQALKGSHGNEAEAQTPETPEDASVSESSGRQPTDQLKQRLSGSYDGLKLDEKGVITYHGATSFFQAIAGDPAKGGLVNNAWHQRALECFTNIPEPFHYLLDLHWCWIQPLFNFVYRPAFTRDIQSNGPYYSHTLLSAIVSHSTRWAKRDPVIQEQLAAYEGGALFRRQARSFLFEELNNGVCTIPMIQTLLLLSAQECSSGNATQAWVYSGIAFRLVDHLGIFIDGQRYAADVHLSEEEVEIRHRLFWSCYFWDKIISLYLGRRPTLTQVSVSPPGFMYDDSAEEEMWIPHGIIFAPGKQYPPTRAHSTSCFIKMCELSVIFNQILINIYDPLHQLSQSVIEGCVRTEGAALQSWWDALPHFLRIDTDNIPAYAPPSHIVTLNSLYHTFKILLFRPTLVKRSRQTSGERTQNQDHLRICVASAVSIAAIFDLFCRTFGEDHCITSLSYSLYIATSIFLLQVQALPGDTQALRRLLFCVQYLERVQSINPGERPRFLPTNSVAPPLTELSGNSDWECSQANKRGNFQDGPGTTGLPRPATIPTAEAGEGSTLSGSIGYEPGHQARSSRDFHGHNFGTASDVDFSLMPDDMFEALSTLEPMSVSIQPLDHSSSAQPAWPFASR